MAGSTERDWEKPIRRLELLLRLKFFPVAMRMLEDKADLDKIKFLRRCEAKATLCQLIARVRAFDWTVGAELDDFLFKGCPSILGLCDVPENHINGTFRSIVWVKSKQEGEKFEKAIPRLETGKYQAVALAPLVYNPFEPDIVLLYANPAQMMLLINALQFEEYETMQFFCVGESSCSDAIVRCYQTGKPSLTIPCYGERRYGGCQDDELVMALPASWIDRALRGLEALYRRGVRYPVSYAGCEADAAELFPPAYHTFDDTMAKVRGDGKRLVVGLTGGIACGKSTVAEMISDLGGHLVDFDLLARLVVEPGQPAYNDIVQFFGEQVLADDKSLDRKKLSAIVFGDMEKRKKLEGFTHPRIHQEFQAAIARIAADEPNAIIVADVPLLTELNLQYLFERVMVVAIPRDLQIKRLMERDGISREEAESILAAQIPIDEKRRLGDYVIDNTGSIEQTRERVEECWAELEEMRRQRS